MNLRVKLNFFPVHFFPYSFFHVSYVSKLKTQADSMLPHGGGGASTFISEARSDTKHRHELLAPLATPRSRIVSMPTLQPLPARAGLWLCRGHLGRSCRRSGAGGCAPAPQPMHRPAKQQETRSEYSSSRIITGAPSRHSTASVHDGS